MSKECLNGSEMSKVEDKVTEFFNTAEAVQVEEGTWYYHGASVESELKSVYEQLAKANERLKELESAILDSCSTYHFEPDLSQPVSSLNELLIINSKWTLDPEISSDAAKFAINQQKKGIKDYISTLDRNLPEKVYLSYLVKDALLYCDNLDKKVKFEGQSLYMKPRKEQDQC